MGERVSILVLAKKTKNERENGLTVYMRVTIDDERFEVSTHRHVESGKWLASPGRVKGASKESLEINRHLDDYKQKVYNFQKNIEREGKDFTKESLRSQWFGLQERTHSLVEVFTVHNSQLKTLIGIDNSKATFTKYCTTLDHTVSFLKWKFNKSDVEISNVNFGFYD